MIRSNRIVDSDTLAIRRASRLVGTRIAIACAAVVAVVIVAVFVYILSEISPGELFEPVPDTENLQVSAFKLLRAAAVLGVGLIVLAGVLSWLVTRRAVQPLGDVLRIQRAFVADASHELRTPLAVLDARLQILQRTLPAEDPSAAVVAELRSDAKDLIHIVNDLLESAEIGGAAVPDTAIVDLVAAVDTAVQSMALIAVDKHITIELDAPQPAPVRVPASSITRCVVALLDNAVRFAPRDSIITVDVTVTKKTVAVTVRDRGPGIQGIDPTRIFDRFAHSGTAMDGGGDARTGFGIGLSLVREIAVRYGGSVHVVDSSAAGTAITLTLPQVKPAAS
ncbi:HAMP domain-containing sensor histidine kinase [Cryobacterium sp. PH31-L1]|uniref:sensor histidine kinase n=1 Tax=Cryobacterium sp. PH31-L1 TaxID=3046199 RepID=UPI0024BB4A70|nr:HAMP domain-containing sensor histidine kinase [Cryobacterium sp. PH31-L1]MDJ0379134.1 HAMP domain-containing sensor histidine kinase [Cryobacterium sp. PH31-L1]